MTYLSNNIIHVFQNAASYIRTGSGAPVYNKDSSLTVGPQGSMLLQDVVFLDELSHFDRERIPERVVHAKGAGKGIVHLYIFLLIFLFILLFFNKLESPILHVILSIKPYKKLIEWG